MASNKQFIEKRDNIASIISFIRSKGSATRLEVSSGLSLSWACVSDLVSLLKEENILIESTRRVVPRSESPGRVPTCLSLNPEKYFLGVDINDTGIAISVLDMNGKLFSSKKWDAETYDKEEELSLSVCEKISAVLSRAEDCCGIGIAMQGARTKEGKWQYPLRGGYTPCDPGRAVELCFGIPVYVRHDPECMLYAVVDSIAEDSMTLRVDNDIGVAAMKNGRILDIPLDLGHIYIGDVKLKTILNEGEASGDFSLAAERIAGASANLAKLLGVKRVFVVGGIIEWLPGVMEIFDKRFTKVASSIAYEVCDVSDASIGAAMLAISEYPQIRAERK